MARMVYDVSGNATLFEVRCWIASAQQDLNSFAASAAN